MRSQQEIRSELHKTGTPHLRRIRVTGEGAGKAPEDTEDYGLTLKELDHDGKLGIHPGSVAVVVIDVDPKNDKELQSIIKNVEKLYGDPIVQIPTPGVGKGKFPGVHMLYRKEDITIKRLKWEHGDIRADSGYVVMHDEELWLEAVKLAPTKKAIDIDLLAVPEATKAISEAHTKEQIISELRLVKDGRNPAMAQAAYKLQPMNCLSDAVERELYVIWQKMGKTSKTEFDRIIRNARKLKIKVNRLVYKTADTLSPKRTRWLWDGWIPLQAITLIAGIEGLGKSTYALHLAARLTRGQLEGEYFKKPVNVSLYTTEDDPQSIIVPRLLAAGADMKRIAFIEGKQKGDNNIQPISIEKDIDLLKSHIVDRDTKVLILDPIVTRLDENRDSNDYRDVRTVLETLGQILQNNDAVCIGVTHFNKSTGPIENRVIGSRAWRAVVRSLVCIHRDEENEHERIVTHSKCNYGPSQQSLRFGFENVKVGEDDGNIVASKIIELGVSDLSDNDAVVAMDNRHLNNSERKVDTAAAWLNTFFDDNTGTGGDGKPQYILRETIIKAAEKAGFNSRIVDRAATNIRKTKDGRQSLWWGAGI